MSVETDNSVNALDESTRRYYLEVMGVQCWQLRDQKKQQTSQNTLSDEDSAVVTKIDGKTADRNVAGSLASDWPQLEASVQQCNKCQLHGGRKQAIIGRGNLSAQLMFVLLAPDSFDDNVGVICSGEADDLLRKMLSAINVSINEVYITSLLKCCVPANHTVTPQQIQHCKNHLTQQIQLVQPKRLVILGESAVRCLLQKNMSLDDYRAMNAQADFQIDSLPVFASYSPRELLLQPENKRKAWSDLQQLQKIINS